MKKIVYTLLIILLPLSIIFYVKVSENKESKDMYGQWKTTELAAESLYGRIYWFDDIYIGRSVTIEPTKITQSISMWPYYLDAQEYNYQYWNEEANFTFGGPSIYKIDDLASNYSKTVSFYENEDYYELNIPNFQYMLLRDDRILVSFGDGWYLAERYKEAKINLTREDLLGEWRIKRLISYENNWIGNQEQLEFCDSAIQELAPDAMEDSDRLITLLNWKNKDDIYFYPYDYYEHQIKIDEEKISLIIEGQVVEEHQVTSFYSQVVDREDYEKAKGIHDELGILNDSIQVFTGELAVESEKNILNNEFIVINEAEIIVKIEQGWFLLQKI